MSSEQKAPELEPCPWCRKPVDFGFFADTPNISCKTCRYERDFYSEDGGPMNRAAAYAAWNAWAAHGAQWQPISTAPLNPAGKAFGPMVSIYCAADGYTWPAYFDPCYEWKHRDIGPAWVIPDQDPPIAPEDATHWKPLAAPEAD